MRPLTLAADTQSFELESTRPNLERVLKEALAILRHGDHAPDTGSQTWSHALDLQRPLPGADSMRTPRGGAENGSRRD